MYRKVLKYVNYNGVPVEEPLYFNYTKPELLRLQRKYGVHDLADHLTLIAGSGDPNRMIPVIEDIIINAYGEKTEDGKSFMKTDHIQAKFENSMAYAELFELLLTNPTELQEFVTGLTNGITKVPDSGVQEPNVKDTFTVQNSSPQGVKTAEELLDQIKNDPILLQQVLDSQKGTNQ